MAGGSQRSVAAFRLRWLLVVGLLVINLVLLVMGSLAALVGGGLTDWGSGAGGLGGWADGSMTIFSLTFGLAAGTATFRAGGSIRLSVIVFATGILVGIGFLTGGHLLDPCARGWWEFNSKTGDTRLCSARHDIALQFHLLLHAIVGTASAVLALALYRGRDLIGRWPPEAPAR
jgi:hypothetical protein